MQKKWLPGYTYSLAHKDDSLNIGEKKKNILWLDKNSVRSLLLAI